VQAPQLCDARQQEEGAEEAREAETLQVVQQTHLAQRNEEV
jgi:hypothetical protein